jgi:hypothetical protein
MRRKTAAARESKKKERPKPKPMEEGPVLYVSSPIAPDTAKLFFNVVKDLLEEKGCKAHIMGEPKIDLKKYDENLLIPYVDLLAEEVRGMENAAIVLNGNPGDIMLMALQEYPSISKHIDRMIFMNCSLHTGKRKEHTDSHDLLVGKLREIEGKLYEHNVLRSMTSFFLASRNGFSIKNGKPELLEWGYHDPDATDNAWDSIMGKNLDAGAGMIRRAMEDWFELMEQIDYEKLYALHGEKMHCFCTSIDAEILRSENLAKVFQVEGAEYHIITLDKPVTTTEIILDVLNGKYD